MYDSMAAKSGYDKAEELVDVERGRRAEERGGGQIGMGNLIEAAILGRFKREEGVKGERIGEARFCEVAKSGKDPENGNFKRV